MGLHLVDTSNTDRTGPTPNTKDIVLAGAVKAHGTTSLNYRSDASDSSTAALKSGMYRLVATNTINVASSDFSSSGNSYLTEVATKLVTFPTVLTYPIFNVEFTDAAGYGYPCPFYSFNYDTGALQYQVIGKVSADGTTGIIEVRSTAALTFAEPLRYYVVQQSSR